MRHKRLILILTAILVVLIVAKVYEPPHFPLRINYFGYSYDSKLIKKSNTLIGFRLSQDFADIPWDVFSIGDNTETVGLKSKNTTDSTIVLNGNTIDARVVKFFSQDDKLVEIDLFFKKPSKNIINDVFAEFGNKYLEIYEKHRGKHFNSRYFWIKDSIFVICQFDYVYNSYYLTIADIRNFSKDELRAFIAYGHVSTYFPEKPVLQSFLTDKRDRTHQRHTSSTTMKKYGNSDVYQGSSKQKEDLKVIDKHLGL